MGCGASSSGAVAAPVDTAPAAETRSAAAGPAGADDEVRECWARIAGGADGATLSPPQVRGVLSQLGRQLSEEEFAAAFERMDTDANGTIEFSEFAKFYKTSTIAEKQKIRALRAHSELRRRLDNGELSPEEEVAVRQRLELPLDPAVSLGLQGTPEEDAAAAKMQAVQRGRADRAKVQALKSEQEAAEKQAAQQKADKLAEQKRLAAAASELAPDPDAPSGRLVVLELKGGNDKQKKGAGIGHRRDTFPICNAVKARGWGCQAALYSAADHEAVAALCEQADGVIVRAAQGEPGVFGDEGPSRLDSLLRDLVDK